MRKWAVVIIGAGPRGAGVLERITTLAGRNRSAHIKVHVVDPGVPGQGIHRGDQPGHLVTNTTASQTTMFVDASVEGAGPPRPGPTFHQSLQRTGYTSKNVNQRPNLTPDRRPILTPAAPR